MPAGQADPEALERAANEGKEENRIVEKARERAHNASQPT
jgi:hypothetical protein